MDDINIHELNARRLLCPMPVIKTQDRIAQLADQAQLRVVCTDPGTLHDIPSWCRINGHDVLQTNELNGEYIFLIRVNHGDSQ